MSGWLGDLSPEQEGTLKEFRKKLTDVLQPHHDDRYLLRWLRARQFDLKKSEEMLRKSLQWRKQSGADSILETFTAPESLTKYYPGGYYRVAEDGGLYGVDKEGSPLYIENLGYADVKGMCRSAKRSDVIKYKIASCERNVKYINAQNEKLGHDCKGFVIICDMQYYGLKHLYKPAMDIYNEVLSIFEAHYPETLKRTYVINEPRLVSVFVNLVKPFLHENTRKKIIFCGANWKQRLLQDIDADQIPVQWGGTACVDGDPLCGVCKGGEIPKEYYITGETSDLSNFKTATISRGSKLQVPIEVGEAGSVIKWQFQTEAKDIKYSLLRRSSEDQLVDKMEQLLPMQKVNSNLVMEDGDFTCEHPGTYILLFDNSYSYLTSKKVKYHHEVLPPCDMGDLHKTPSFCVPDL